MKRSFVSDFRKFIMRGNVVDMAVGVVVGGAFSKIVSSLVGDILMPAIGLVTGRVDVSSWSIPLAPAADGGEALVLHYGVFIQNIIDFLLIALCVFTAVRLLNSLHRKAEESPAPPPEPPKPSDEVVLLGEIRDLLRDRESIR